MYTHFILYLSKPGQPTQSTFYTNPTPIPWITARDRLQKAGILNGYKAGSYSDGWMLSIDTKGITPSNPTALP